MGFKFYSNKIFYIIDISEETSENKEIDFEFDRRFESPKQNYIEEYHEKHIIEEDQIPPQDDNNINVELSQQNQIQEEEYQYNPINKEINQIIKNSI